MAAFTDIHCHGGGGHAFGDSVAGTRAAFAAHRAHGTSQVVASLVSMSLADLERAMDVIRAARTYEPGILGVHLEGPFLAPERKGAHDPAALAIPTQAVVADVLDIVGDDLRQITIAPELPGAMEAIRTFSRAGAVVAVGHTTADAATTTTAFEAGASLITHGLNAMAGMAAREIGPVGAAIADPFAHIELIADGIHVNPTLIRTVFAAAPGRVVLVTDAMAAAASTPGAYRLGSLDVEVKDDGRAVLAGTDTLAGSTLTMDRAVEVCVAAGVPRDQAEAAASTVPARLIRR
ncbi:N-acetylglucosamine-6-phosphate deacetylase [Demequina sp.]|uniref:N-acetylglucosamine-6-phosphate deacetylase n=1 Tax=Demequina sp. TaxID=2050685 RepID=UPI003D0D9F0E